jgi:hypothetical protein
MELYKPITKIKGRKERIVIGKKNFKRGMRQNFSYRYQNTI